MIEPFRIDMFQTPTIVWCFEDVLLGQPDEGAEKELLSVPPTDFRESLLEDEPSGHDLATMALFLQNAPGLSMRLPGEGRRPRMMNIPEDDSETSLTSKVSHESAASAEVEIKELVEKEQAGPEETQEDRRRSTLGALPGTGFISSLMSKLRVKRQLKKQSAGPTAPDAPQAVPTFSLQQATPETSHHSIYSLTHFTSKADEAARDKKEKDEDGTAV
ncbi:uncharacterized protein [Ptychodera flava]|uniref:uncharacterized protein n=1 Tax=Ptychodera flava TaxID=63121 RepID=UPI00396A971A